MRFASTLLLLSLFAPAQAQAAESPATVSEGKDVGGVLVHEVTSPFQAGKTTVRVLVPERLEKGKRYAVVYVLPVEARDEARFGDGLAEIKKLDLHNTYDAVFVAPTFSHLPWYADHPTNPQVRQETYLLDVVLPFVERQYPVRTDAAGRLLLGFSKSGWGAFSLLLRHPDRFGKAAAWDAPLMMDAPGRFGSGDIFGTAENFERYRITKLLELHAPDPRDARRLVLLGYGNFREHHQQAHALMEKLKIEHAYRDGPALKHEWGSGWVAEAVKLLGPAGGAGGRSAINR